MSGAHVLLPALAWGEKSGTVTNSERRISRQRAFLPAPGEARPDWWIVSEVAKRLGFGAAFDFKSAADVFREHAALSAFENAGNRDFDIGALQAVSDDGYDIMAPVLWPLRQGEQSQARFFGEGGFYTGDRKARFIAPEIPALRTETHPGRPLRLNTGRVRDQWHTMTRTGLSPRLGQHLPEPYVEVHPDDAGQYGVERRQLCARHHRLRPVHPQSRRQRAAAARHVVRADPLERDQRLRGAHRRAGCALHRSVLGPARDPSRRRPRSRHMNMCSAASCCRARSCNCPTSLWWARAAVNGGYGYLFADNAELSRWPSWLRAAAEGDVAEYRDFGGGVFRAASFVGDRIEACLFVGPAHDAGDWDVVKHLFAAETLTDDERRMLLSGRSTEGVVSAGPVVCACFGVGRASICDAIAAGATTAAEIGVQLKAGTNCGSCHSRAETTDRANSRKPVAAASGGCSLDCPTSDA